MKLSKQIQLILTEGKHTGSHKFAFLRAILDYIVDINPSFNKDLKIPLIYIAEKFLTYYWVMYVNNEVKQITMKNRFLYYDYLRTLIDEMNIPVLSNNRPAEKHIHTLLYNLRNSENLSRKTITALKRTRSIIFEGPVKHTCNVSSVQGSTKIDFYKYEGELKINVKRFDEFYNKENCFIVIKSRYIREFKEMYYWFEKAIITVWAEFTDQLIKGRKKNFYTGLTLLAIPDTERENLNIFRKHFENIGKDKCTYCGGKFEEIDHVIPWKRVKKDQFWNMLPACRKCNSAKSDKILPLNNKAKNTLQVSISHIVNALDNHQEFKNQVDMHYALLQKNKPKDPRRLSEDLMKLTLNKITSFNTE